jgi:hypothetical protein
MQHQVRKKFLCFFLSFYSHVFSGYVTREQGEQVLNRLNRYYKQVFQKINSVFINEIFFSFSYRDTTKSTSTTTTPVGGSQPVTTTWEQHWSKLDDGSGRYVFIELHNRIIIFLSFSVPQEKFVEYVTTSDDYKNNLNRPLV